jgi:ABC-type polysaccharide/polyol phosphate transport system ATPase subunit
MAAVLQAEKLGIRFIFDGQARPVTPGVARLRIGCSEGWGLRGLDFAVGPGEAVALVGPNGAGKTTLLRALAGVYDADEGVLMRGGRVGSLLSVDAGLVAQLTGRENCLLLGVLAGLRRAEVQAALPEIRRRSELGEAFDHVTSTYSAGMRARLGFVVMEHAQPEILLLDEVHQAFDHRFRALVEARAQEILASGGIVVAAGHDHAMLGRLCDRAFLLEGGRLRADGPFEEVREQAVAHMS